MAEKLFHEKFRVVDSSGNFHNAIARIDTDSQDVDTHLTDGREIRISDETELRYEIAKTGEALARVS